MRPRVIRHRVSALRRRGAATLRTRTELHADVDDGGVRLRFASPGPLDDSFLVEALERMRAAVAMPDELHGELVLEAGVVEQSVAREGKPAAPTRRRYGMVSCRGVLLALGDPEGLGRVARWRRVLESDRVDPGLPVVLGPSAALSAALHVLELATAGEAPRPATLSIAADVPSPYPPHAAPSGLDGASFDPILLRPATWSRPFAALSNDSYHTAALRCAEAPGVAPPTLVLEALLPLHAGGGSIEWEAQCALAEADGVTVYRRPRRVRLDAGATLASARALGALRPALAEDAVWGDTYGWAPALATALCAGDLRA